jgi:hypothetical protein
MATFKNEAHLGTARWLLETQMNAQAKSHNAGRQEELKAIIAREETCLAVQRIVAKEAVEGYNNTREIIARLRRKLKELKGKGPSRGPGPSTVRRGLRTAHGSSKQSAAAAERRQTRNWADPAVCESEASGGV